MGRNFDYQLSVAHQPARAGIKMCFQRTEIEIRLTDLGPILRGMLPVDSCTLTVT